MTNKAKILLAEYVSQAMSCPRNLELWKIRAVESFLKSGHPVTKKGIKGYVAALEPTMHHLPSETEGALMELLSPKRQKTNRSGVKSEPSASESEPLAKPERQPLNSDLEKTLASFERWLIGVREFSPNTAKSYIQSMKRYFSMFSAVTQKNSVAYKQNLLASGLSYTTINLRLSGVVAFGKFIGKKIDVKHIRVPRTMECNNVPSEDEMAVYLKLVKEKNFYWYLVSRCLSTTGLRVHELLKLTYKDILNGDVVLIGKGGKPRRVFFQQKFVEEIKSYILTKNVLADERFCGKTTRGVASQIKTYSRLAGLDAYKFHPHAFRHYFAKQYLKKNPTDIVGLQNLLGHSNIETTSIYLQRSREEQLRDFHDNVTWE